MIDNTLEQRIEAIETSLNTAIQRIGILASILSRYQFCDPRFCDIGISVLDRLQTLEDRKDRREA